MKLLLDENLSSTLRSRLADLCDAITHIKVYNLLSADDALIWQHAKAGGFTVATKEEDFRDRLAVVGHPLRIILIRLGNCSASVIEDAIRRAWPFVQRLHERENASLLLISTDSAFLRVEPDRD